MTEGDCGSHCALAEVRKAEGSETWDRDSGQCTIAVFTRKYEEADLGAPITWSKRFKSDKRLQDNQIIPTNLMLWNWWQSKASTWCFLFNCCFSDIDLDKVFGSDGW